jgi:hypothetical protein
MNKLIISVPTGTSENFNKRNLNQFIFGEIGIGPRVLISTVDGVYISEKSPYPSIARSGGDIMEKMKKVDSVMDKLDIMYDNTNLSNITHDTNSNKFQIIDAGGSSVPSKLSSKFKSDYDSILKNKTKSDINNFIKSNSIKVSKIGSGEARNVYEIDSRILELFK